MTNHAAKRFAKWKPIESERERRIRRELGLVEIEERRLTRLARKCPTEAVYRIARDARRAEAARLTACLLEMGVAV